ncbi:MAG: type II toxin-antitoxin system RelE/ParE family toxin [Cyanobacteria bacterium P01_C01_bin.72]
MTKRILLRPRASQDLDDCFTHIAENDPKAAFEFFDAARLTIAQLSKMPGLGSLYRVNSPRLQGLRKWPVKDFRKYLIFYLDQDNCIEIIRILYAARDLSSILERER